MESAGNKCSLGHTIQELRYTDNIEYFYDFPHIRGLNEVETYCREIYNSTFPIGNETIGK